MTRGNGVRVALALAALAVLAPEASTGAIASPAAASSPADLDAAARKLSEAGAALQQAETAGDRVTALASAIPAYEAALASLRDVAIGAGVGERQIATDLADRRESVMELTAALQAMSRTPPPVQALHPGGPLAAARAAALLSRVTPALGAEAAELRGRLEALERIRQLRRTALDDISAGLEDLTRARLLIRDGMAARQDGAPPDTAAIQTEVVRDSASLSTLAESLTETPARSAGAEEADGSWAWPIAGGRQILGFRERDAGGERRPGLLVQAAPLSLVEAPTGAMVRYAGPFLEYGTVVVLETDAGTVVVLAGLAQTNVRAGEPVARGALLGLLGGRTLEAEEYVMLPVAEAGAGAAETLYIEIRHGRGPVDPAPWFGGGNGQEIAQ